MINSEAKRRGIKIHITCDFVHVLEYLWSAAWSFFDEGDSAAETWVADKELAVLEGKAGIVAGAIRRKATTPGLDKQHRKRADTSSPISTDNPRRRVADRHRSDRRILPIHRP